MKTIIAPVDFSAATRGVLNTVRKVASPDAKIYLLHCLVPPMVTTDYGVGLETLQETMALAEKTALQQLEHLEDQLTKEGFKVSATLDSAPASSKIVELAAKKKAEAIVLGSHGHTAIYDLLVGSTTHAVIKSAPCPVIVVPPEVKKSGKKKNK